MSLYSLSDDFCKCGNIFSWYGSEDAPKFGCNRCDILAEDKYKDNKRITKLAKSLKEIQNFYKKSEQISKYCKKEAK